MIQRHYPQLGETAWWGQLPNGLTIAVVPRPGFSKALAYFVTDYGAIHTEYTVDGVAHTAPSGVAHYLEHKLFDMPGSQDVTAEFAALGAIPNAFTSYDMTAYHFSCTENFRESLQLLLQFVSTPHFTPETVAKEQGIIGQEIEMNRDNPDARVFELLMEAMYVHHPVRVPILGTRESIAQITDKTLYDCHQAFYHPGNMLLCVVGDVDPQEVEDIARKVLPERSGSRGIARKEWDESTSLDTHFVSARMEVAMPLFQLGFKCQPADTGEAAIRQEIIGDLAAEALFGESSALYMQLYQEGLIDSSFGGGFETIEGMTMLTASGDSDDPKAVRDAILARARELALNGIAQDVLQRMKRSAFGRRVRGLDSFDSVCFRICAYHLSGFDYFRFPEIYEAVTAEDIQAFYRQVVTLDSCCLSVIYPNEGGSL